MRPVGRALGLGPVDPAQIPPLPLEATVTASARPLSCPAPSDLHLRRLQSSLGLRGTVCASSLPAPVTTLLCPCRPSSECPAASLHTFSSSREHPLGQLSVSPRSGPLLGPSSQVPAFAAMPPVCCSQERSQCPHLNALPPKATSTTCRILVNSID